MLYKQEVFTSINQYALLQQQPATRELSTSLWVLSVPLTSTNQRSNCTKLKHKCENVTFLIYCTVTVKASN